MALVPDPKDLGHRNIVGSEYKNLRLIRDLPPCLGPAGLHLGASLLSHSFFIQVFLRRNKTVIKAIHAMRLKTFYNNNKIRIN